MHLYTGSIDRCRYSITVSIDHTTEIRRARAIVCYPYLNLVKAQIERDYHIDNIDTIVRDMKDIIEELPNA